MYRRDFICDAGEGEMTKFWVVLLGAALPLTNPVAQSQPDARQRVIERAKSLELNTPYVPPPGDPMEHYASGYAKIMCSSVFITGLDPAFAAENVGYFTAPYAERAKLGTPKIDREKRTVQVTMPNGKVRTAKQVASQGCVTLPIGQTDVFFKPSIVKSALPDPKTQPWPMGDVLPSGTLPPEVNQAKIQQAVDADFDQKGPYADHLYLYTGSVDSFKYAATRPLQWPPNTIGRYHNTDPVLTNYLIRLAVEKRNEDYHSFPQRALFDKIGMRTMVLDTDPYGNFLLQGYEQGSGRDWARLANLYLQDGVWNRERILPEGYVKFVSTLAPAWEADKRPIYGGLFWLNGDGTFPAPKETFYMNGAGGQFVLIIPSYQLAIVRLGHYKGASAGGLALRKAVAMIMDAVPPVDR